VSASTGVCGICGLRYDTAVGCPCDPRSRRRLPIPERKKQGRKNVLPKSQLRRLRGHPGG